jgi:hypothetical protein
VISYEVLDCATRPWGYGVREAVRGRQPRRCEWFEADTDGSIRIHHERGANAEGKRYLAVPEERCGVVGALANASG